MRKHIPELAVRYVSGGYVLELVDASLDSAGFEQDLDEAQAHRGDLEKLETILGRALGRWRGPALADVAGASWAQGDSTRLKQLRLGALEAWLMTLIETGRTGQAVAEAEAAVEANPLTDGLWAALMVALYRSGRQAEAMRAPTKECATSWPNQGFEPSARLSEIEEAIARDDPDLPGGGVGSAAPITVGLPSGSQAETGIVPDLPEVKGNLPNEISSFVGRETELAEVRDLLGSLAPGHDHWRRWVGQDPTRGAGGHRDGTRVRQQRLVHRPRSLVGSRSCPMPSRRRLVCVKTPIAPSSLRCSTPCGRGEHSLS